MDVQMISKQMIKPSFPTPSHLQNMSISLMDQLVSPRTVPHIFYYYYSANGNYQGAHSTEHVERQKSLMEKSLSEILTLYYPLAGRYIKENHLINCNDEGVEYVEALVNGQLSQILHGEIEPKELNRFVPDEVEESATSALFAIQINIFKCGGLAIGVRLSHRIVDAYTFSLFMNGWAKACKLGNINDAIVPNFECGILFPPIDISGYELPPLSKSKYKSDQVVTKRLVFDAKTISKLKADHQAAMRLNCKP
ncbi:hypothetical protein LWI29_013263 [Acer saccharum]|uniref:Uncharacterized protein n=1 Tax=Acer saccharum TaxID=4024 RepID=A0AA39VIE1_ACESA|nr:hypothetical protein LWI29_013263 [Acer saccharum]